QSRDVTFERPGIVRVECSVHENMNAYIVVVSEPYATLVEAGRFSFRSLPAGKYRLRAWAERTGTATEKDIVVRDGKNVVSVDIDDQPPGQWPRTNKLDIAPGEGR